MLNKANNLHTHHSHFDQHGRTIYGNSVHLDVYPLRYFVSAALLALLAPHLPTLGLIILIIAYAAILCHNLFALAPAGYAPRTFRQFFRIGNSDHTG